MFPDICQIYFYFLISYLEITEMNLNNEQKEGMKKSIQCQHKTMFGFYLTPFKLLLQIPSLFSISDESVKSEYVLVSKTQMLFFFQRSIPFIQLGKLFPSY